MDESFENGHEMYINEGILLQQGPAEFISEIRNATTGTLSLVCYQKRLDYYIEWKPNDILIADADALENDEWSFVDTVKKRQRTASETLIFNTPSPPLPQPPTPSSQIININNNNSNNSYNNSHYHNTNSSNHNGNKINAHLSAVDEHANTNTNTNNQSLTGLSPRLHQQSPPTNNAIQNPISNHKLVLRVKIFNLKRIELEKNGHGLRLIQRVDGKLHSRYFFQNGNADGFVRSLQTIRCLQRNRTNRSAYDVVVETIEDHDQEKIQKAFEELNINDIKNTREQIGIRWISHIVRNPLGNTINFLSTKMSDYGVLGGLSTEEHPYQHPEDRVRQSSSPNQREFNDYDSNHSHQRINSHHQQISPSAFSDSDAFNTSFCRNSNNGNGSVGDEYEVLGISPKQNNNHINHNNIIKFKKINSTHDDDDETEQQQQQQRKQQQSYLPLRPTVHRGKPLSTKQWREFFAEDGCVSDVERIKEIIFRGGVEPELRAEVWKYLLDYYQWTHTNQQREHHKKQKEVEYFKMKVQWLSMTDVQEKNFTDYRERKCQIDKDVKRTDRTIPFYAGDNNPNLNILQDILMTYVMYNFDLGYVQGMSDLLAPILSIMINESDAFWCFVGFMDMLFNNFDMDQSGMINQLQDVSKLIAFGNPTLSRHFNESGSDNMYFCFRWVLVWFKREFSNDDINRLWECLWTGLPCSNFHLIICFAILDDQHRIFIDNNYEFTEILKHVNELSMNIDLDTTLAQAESIYLQIREALQTLAKVEEEQEREQQEQEEKEEASISSSVAAIEEKRNQRLSSIGSIGTTTKTIVKAKIATTTTAAPACPLTIDYNAIRVIIGEQPFYPKSQLNRNGGNHNNNNNHNTDFDDEDDNFDGIQILRNCTDEEIYQQKLDEACEKSMYGSYF